MKTGLVMEGGSMRGIFTCGILDVLMENGIYVDGAVGVSAGAAFGINYKSRQIGRGVRYNKQYCGDKRYASWESLIKTGDIFNVEFCYRTLPLKLDVWDYEEFQSNPMDFYCVATDINSGRPVYHKLGDTLESDMYWIRASASIPVLSRPVKINGGEYLDGGIADSIPLKFMEQMGYDKIIVIETQPKNYIKKKQPNMPFIRWKLKNYPNMIDRMAKRHVMYNSEKRYIRERESEGDILVLRPEQPLGVGNMPKDPSELERVYQLGRAQANARIDEIKAFLS